MPLTTMGEENLLQDNKSNIIEWDVGTAYDFMISLAVIHQPDEFGLRASWAAGVRSRLPAAERKFLETISPFMFYPIHWIYRLPEPKDATSLLWSLRQIPVDQRIDELHISADLEPELVNVFSGIKDKRKWDDNDLDVVREVTKKWKEKPRLKDLQQLMNWWTRPEEYGELILSSLQAYYQGFFAEEEKRIAPSLKKALQEAKAMAEKLEIGDLLAELSQGLHFEDRYKTGRLILVPVYWSTPLVVQGKVDAQTNILCFGGRPKGNALVPGEQVPDDLMRALKALADPTRLKILRYLATEPLTPAELARRLRLRAPTVVHHLKELRIAGLVQITLLAGGERRYEPRPEAITDTFSSFQDFISSES